MKKNYVVIFSVTCLNIIEIDEHIEDHIEQVECSRDVWRDMTLKGQGRNSKHLRLNISTIVPYKLQ